MDFDEAQAVCVILHVKYFMASIEMKHRIVTHAIISHINGFVLN
jgi:hypothetical protein